MNNGRGARVRTVPTPRPRSSAETLASIFRAGSRYGRQAACSTWERMSRRRGRGRGCAERHKGRRDAHVRTTQRHLTSAPVLVIARLDSESDGQANGTKDPPPRRGDLSCDPNWRRGVRRGGQYPYEPSGHNQRVRHQSRRRGMDRRAPAPSTVRRRAEPLVSQVGSQWDQAPWQRVSRRAQVVHPFGPGPQGC
jgi:hypothetical protein